MAVPCGTASISSILEPSRTSDDDAMWMLMVVLPEPPFWFTAGHFPATTGANFFMRLTFAALAATLALAAQAAGRPPLHRSPDGNTVTIELFNRGAATWAAGRSGSSGARTAYTTEVSLNDGFPIDLLVDTGAMGLCIIQQEIDWMLSGVNHFGKPSLFPSDYRGRTVIETASGQRLIRDKWNIREVYAFGFVLHNVEAVSCGKNGSLLGQGVLARFKNWSIDNEKGTITVVGPPINGNAVR